MRCPLVRVFGADGTTRWATRRGLAMAVEEPLGHLVDDGTAGPPQLPQAGEDAIDEGAQPGSQVTARIPLEIAPLALLGIELWGVLGQPDDLQPVPPRGERRHAHRAGM